MQQKANKPLQSDQNMLTCLLLSQKSRQHILAPEQGRYAINHKGVRPMKKAILAIASCIFISGAVQAEEYLHGQSGTSYRDIGSSTYGSDGTSYRSIGNTTYGSDGTSSRKIGNSTYNSDGSSSRQIGNTLYNSDGSTVRKIGNTTYGSDGTTCRKIGSSTYCN